MANIKLGQDVDIDVSVVAKYYSLKQPVNCVGTVLLLTSNALDSSRVDAWVWVEKKFFSVVFPIWPIILPG